MQGETFSDEEKAVLAKFIAHTQSRDFEKAPPLSDTEIEHLRRWLEVYKSFDTLGRFATFARNTVIWIGVMFGAWYAFKGWLVEIAQHRVGGG
jgi:hypothetical protein